MRGAAQSAQGQLFHLQRCWPGLAAPSSVQLRVPHSHLLAWERKHTSQAQRELQAERHEGTLFRAVADAFFALVPTVLGFARSALLLWTLETSLDLPCSLETSLDLPHSAGNLQSFIYFIIFCNLASILPCSLRYRLSPSVLLHHLAQAAPDLSWAQKYSLPFLLVFVNCNALYYTDFSGNTLPKEYGYKEWSYWIP